ncbi:MAG: DUF3373 family protein, partial [Campylobacteraceae bacterium]|nr:DUF3373 family protein [Campylobacteraceae bacterium]
IAAQLAAMKQEIASLKSQLSTNTASIAKVDKLAKKATKKANHAKMLANGDNLKFSVNFRTSIDKINYSHAGGTKSKNDGLMTNRLWLKAAYAPSENVSFRSTLAYNKAYGDSANHSQINGSKYADFDWVTNENALGNELKVKEAYWLYQNDTFLGNDISWTASVGRRPSTGGQGINLREGEGEQSPLAHATNVEFDGASFRFNLDKVTPLTGGWIKLCMGRGLTNATSRFQGDGADYATDEDTNLHGNVDMVGFIFVPYDDGQYSVNTQYSVAKNFIGFEMGSMTTFTQADGTQGAQSTAAFQDVGDLKLANVMFKANGIGEGINDFLDDTNLVASWAQSKSVSNGQMLGDPNNQTGHSEWIALNMPAGDDARFGLEWNQGSKWWRAVTYAEDTMIGSKLAARGTAVEAYYNRNLTKALSMSLRATKITYDWTGSNGFGGVGSAPTDMSTITSANAAMYGNPVKEAKDIRLAITYSY